MQKTLLFLFSIWSMTLAISAQTDRAEYGAVQSRIVGTAITTPGTVYSFSGSILAGGDGNFFRDTLSLDGANNLIPQIGNDQLSGQTTLDTWFDDVNDIYYQLEIVYFNCDAGAVGMQITSFSKDDPDQVSHIDIADVGVNFFSTPSLAVLGDRFVIREESQIITSRFDSLQDTTIILLRNPRNDKFPSAITTTDEIHIADGQRIISIDNDGAVSEIMLPEPIIGLGNHGFTNPDVHAVTASSMYQLIDGNVIDVTPFDENYTFESLVMNPFGRGFLCTFREGNGVLKYGINSGDETITSFTDVDPLNPGRFTEYIQTTTSSGGNARSVAVLLYEHNNTSILMSTQNAIEFVDHEDIDVEIIGAELTYIPDDPPPGGLYFAAPTIKNNSSDTIETLQVHGEYFVGICGFRNKKTYTDLELLPGEERQLDEINISSPALNFVNNEITGKLYLTTANNFPLKQGSQRSTEFTLVNSSTKEAFGKTVSVYPNPAKGTVQVDLEAGESIQQVRAIDVLGRDMGEIPFSASTVDVSSLIKGRYLLEIRLAGERVAHASLVKG